MFAALLAALVARRFLTRPVGTRHAAVGRELPDFPLEPLTGSEPPVSPGQLRGQIALLTLWGPWCPSCVREFPELASLRQELDGRPFRWLPVTVGGDLTEDLLDLRESTRQFLERSKLTGQPTFADPTGAARKAIGRTLAASSLPVPTTLLVDSHQVIRAVWQGYAPSDLAEMRALIESLLADQAKRAS